MTWHQIHEMAQSQGEQLVIDTIDVWPEAEELKSDSEYILFINQTPHLFAAETGLSIIYMFDEFQRMDQLIYMDQEKTCQCHRLNRS